MTPLLVIVLLLCVGNVAFAMSLAGMNRLPPQAKAQRIMAVGAVEAIVIVALVAYVLMHHGRF